jgi:hypothetical protein
LRDCPISSPPTPTCAVANAEMEGFGADIDPAVGAEPTAATAQVGVGGEEIGQSRKAVGGIHSCRT